LESHSPARQDMLPSFQGLRQECGKFVRRDCAPLLNVDQLRRHTPLLIEQYHIVCSFPGKILSVREDFFINHTEAQLVTIADESAAYVRTDRGQALVRARSEYDVCPRKRNIFQLGLASRPSHYRKTGPEFGINASERAGELCR